MDGQAHGREVFFRVLVNAGGESGGRRHEGRVQLAHEAGQGAGCQDEPLLPTQGRPCLGQVGMRGIAPGPREATRALQHIGHTIAHADGKERKTHIPSDLVVNHWTSAVESSSPLDFLLRHVL